MECPLSGTVQYSTAQYSTKQHRTKQYSTVNYNTECPLSGTVRSVRSVAQYGVSAQWHSTRAGANTW